MEVALAKPVDKDAFPRSPKQANKQLAMPAFYVPVDQFGSVMPFYPSYYSPPRSVCEGGEACRCVVTYWVTCISVPCISVPGSEEVKELAEVTSCCIPLVALVEL